MYLSYKCYTSSLWPDWTWGSAHSDINDLSKFVIVIFMTFVFHAPMIILIIWLSTSNININNVSLILNLWFWDFNDTFDNISYFVAVCLLVFMLSKLVVERHEMFVLFFFLFPFFPTEHIIFLWTSLFCNALICVTCC
jgi:hypothetical protein